MKRELPNYTRWLEIKDSYAYDIRLISNSSKASPDWNLHWYSNILKSAGLETNHDEHNDRSKIYEIGSEQEFIKRCNYENYVKKYNTHPEMFNVLRINIRIPFEPTEEERKLYPDEIEFLNSSKKIIALQMRCPALKVLRNIGLDIHGSYDEVMDVVLSAVGEIVSFSRTLDDVIGSINNMDYKLAALSSKKALG